MTNGRCGGQPYWIDSSWEVSGMSRIDIPTKNGVVEIAIHAWKVEDVLLEEGKQSFRMDDLNREKPATYLRARKENGSLVLEEFQRKKIYWEYFPVGPVLWYKPKDCPCHFFDPVRIILPWEREGGKEPKGFLAMILKLFEK